MDKMKTFALLALAAIAFFIFSNIMIDIAIKTSYAPIDAYVTLRDNKKVDIKEARATYANGYVGGNVTNTGSTIEKTYLKINLYSKRDVLLGTKYVVLEDWKQNETREFKMGFRFTDVDYCKVDITSEVKEEDITDIEKMSEDLRGAKLLATVVLLCFM